MSERAQTALKESDIEKLIEVWKVLEALTVSLDRMGTYWSTHGEQAAKGALHEYIDPAMTDRIARARRLLVGILSEQGPDVERRLEAMAEAEDEVGYWAGPTRRDRVTPAQTAD